jgi:hypothetical protein
MIEREGQQNVRPTEHMLRNDYWGEPVVHPNLFRKYDTVGRSDFYGDIVDEVIAYEQGLGQGIPIQPGCEFSLDDSFHAYYTDPGTVLSFDFVRRERYTPEEFNAQQQREMKHKRKRREATKDHADFVLSLSMQQWLKVCAVPRSKREKKQYEQEAGYGITKMEHVVEGRDHVDRLVREVFLGMIVMHKGTKHVMSYDIYPPGASGYYSKPYLRTFSIDQYGTYSPTLVKRPPFIVMQSYVMPDYDGQKHINRYNAVEVVTSYDGTRKPSNEIARSLLTRLGSVSLRKNLPASN